MPLSRSFDPIVIEKGVENDEFYEGLIEGCITLLKNHDFKEAGITIHQLISIQVNREMLNKPV